MNEKGFNLAGRSLFIGLPAYDFKVSLKLAISLARVAQAAQVHGIGIHIGSVCGCSLLPRVRNLLVQDLLDTEATDLLFVDSDINFDPDDVFRLMAWNKDIAAGVPRTRGVEKVYIADLDYDDNQELTMNGYGLVRATRVATAFMLVKRAVFEGLIELHPEWKYRDHRSDRDLHAVFDLQLTPEGYMGEDFLFCDRAREAGFTVWIDPSIKLGHMGVQEYEGSFGEDVLYPMLVPKQEAA